MMALENMVCMRRLGGLNVVHLVKCGTRKLPNGLPKATDLHSDSLNKTVFCKD